MKEFINEEKGTETTNSYRSLDIPKEAIKKARTTEIIFLGLKYLVAAVGLVEFLFFVGFISSAVAGDANSYFWPTFKAGVIVVLAICWGVLYCTQVIGEQAVFTKYSKRCKPNEKLFIVDENNIVVPVFYVDREVIEYNLIGWNISEPKYLYKVKYNPKDEYIRYISASKIFPTSEDAEIFAQIRKNEQITAFNEEFGEAAARKMFDDPEINDIISIYSSHWDVYSCEKYVNNYEYFKLWGDKIRGNAMAYTEKQNNKYNDFMLITDYHDYYYPIGAFMDDINFLVDKAQVHNFMRFYVLWKESEEDKKRKDNNLNIRIRELDF